jgi:type IV pilus assembly protein PilY1
MILYTVFAFDDDPDARRLLQDAARNGGFIDLNGNNRPDGDYDDPAADRLEWDKDGDGIPDTYFEAKDGYQLEEKLIAAITDILKRASSGTAVSVLATSSEGEGTLIQAYFKPSVSTGIEEIDWVGYLQVLWVDNEGRLREDTVQGAEPGLDPANDQIVEFFFDSASGEAKFRRFSLDANGDKEFTDTDGDGEKDADEDYIFSIHLIEDLSPVWEAGELLADRDPADRSITTWVDLNGDGAVDEGEVVPFDSEPANLALIQNFLGIEEQTFLGGAVGDNAIKAKNLINFIRGDHGNYEGTPAPTPRNRTLNGQVWKLGDIVHSTPVTIGRPLDNYGIIYGDSSYQAYFDKYRERESVVFVGGNDGMLHAFLLGRFKQGDNPNTEGIVEAAYLDRESTTTENLGDELWAYIPQGLLPHLKWLADPDYTHVYYVDLKPRVVDAQIFTPDPDIHPGGWGTVIIGGMNLGGKDIGVDVGGAAWRQFQPSYFAIDITDPHNPELLWERTYPELSLTTNIPTVARVGGNWFAVLGSGPTDYDGNSTHVGHLYIADLLTGELRAQFDTGEANSFMGSPITVDVGLNYNVDVAYIGESYPQGGNWRGKMYRLEVPILDQSDPDPNDWVYDSDPSNWPATGFKAIFNANGPITAAPAASIDMEDRFWVYFGTGRFFSEADKVDTSTQYIYGLKDPFYNHTMYADLGIDPSTVLPIEPLDMMNSTDIDVFTDQSLSGAPPGVNSWTALLEYMETKDGWYIELGQEAVYAGERVVTESKVLGGIVLTPTFIPNQDSCGYGGFSNLYGGFFETGTAYFTETFEGGSEEVSVGGETKTKVEKFIELGLGMGSSVGLHVGQEDGAKGYIQQSTGVVQDVDINPALKVKSGLIYWREH